MRSCVLAAFLLSFLGCAQEPSVPTIKNIVVVCIDTVRYDTFEFVETGTEGEGASLWRRALRFDRAQSSAPWTLPSVASALTGLYPNTHGGGAFANPVANLGAQWPTRLPEAISTLPERLAAHDFASAAFVAHPWFKKLFGLAQGFDVAHIEPGPSGALVDQAATWLDELVLESDPPRFFLYLHFMEAHSTIFDDRERSNLIGALPDELRSRALVEAPAAICEKPDSVTCEDYLIYVSRVRMVRRGVERLLEVLEARGLLESTAVALFSDHGSEFLEHAEAERQHDVDPRGSFGRFHGHALYQELLHVPLLFWHPALPGQRSNAPVSVVDITPTLLDWLGLESPPESQGRSLAGALGGDSFDSKRPLFSSGLAYGPEREAVVVGGKKRISAGGGAPALLFDLPSDPGEREPEEGSSPDLDLLLGTYRAQRVRPGKPVEPLSPELLSRLQALGYLTDVTPEE